MPPSLVVVRHVAGYLCIGLAVALKLVSAVALILEYRVKRLNVSIEVWGPCRDSLVGNALSLAESLEDVGYKLRTVIGPNYRHRRP